MKKSTVVHEVRWTGWIGEESLSFVGKNLGTLTGESLCGVYVDVEDFAAGHEMVPDVTVTCRRCLRRMDKLKQA